MMTMIRITPRPPYSGARTEYKRHIRGFVGSQSKNENPLLSSNAKFDSFVIYHVVYSKYCTIKKSALQYRVGWMVGWLVGLSVSQFFRPFVSHSVCYLICWLAGLFVGWLVSCLEGCLVRSFVRHSVSQLVSLNNLKLYQLEYTGPNSVS